MFASILPSVRDLRVPLIAGALWLTTLWFALYDRIPPPAREILEPLWNSATNSDIGSFLAPGVIIGVVAYLAGIMSMAITQLLPGAVRLALAAYGHPRDERWGPVMFVLRFIRSGGSRESQFNMPRLQYHIASSVEQKYALDDAFWLVCQKMLSDSRDEGGRLELELQEVLRGGRDIEDGSRTARIMLLKRLVQLKDHVDDLVEELRLLPARLAEENPKSYEQWNRLDGEAQFRIGLSLPLAAACTAFVLRILAPYSTVVIVLGLLAAIAIGISFLALGMDRERDTGEHLGELVIAGVVQSEAVDRLDISSLQWVVPFPAQEYADLAREKKGREPLVNLPIIMAFLRGLHDKLKYGAYAATVGWKRHVVNATFDPGDQATRSSEEP